MVNQNAPPRGLLLDFYGTVTEGDDAVTGEICQNIAQASSVAVTPADVGSYWGRVYGHMRSQSFGSSYQPQKELGRLSLRRVLQYFESDLDSDGLSQILHEYWSHPGILPSSREVLAQCRIPICLVSNVDNAELQSALRHSSLSFDHVVTSEDCRAYKPRGEMFEKALSLLGLSAPDALHVGDSLGSDVHGARSQGIPVLWVNRRNRPAPDKEPPDYILADLGGLLDILQRAPYHTPSTWQCNRVT